MNVFDCELIQENEIIYELTNMSFDNNDIHQIDLVSESQVSSYICNIIDDRMETNDKNI
jgi:hypothetical protein